MGEVGAEGWVTWQARHLYADDDHCAMGHAVHWSELSVRFLRDHLVSSDTAEPVMR
ncbi:hypothetical protein ACWDUL_25210 [Nocardia niigatensis]|uniref:hypothetical protein n=1 Tax=Nocardia niigatensis TaxID=209249 RepID=UPI0002E668BA|nr:hypothetical protein [Nocardia niigatensis]